jgi:adenosine deaminase
MHTCSALSIDSTLPLIDLHRHLDGNVRLETLLDLADRHGIKLPAKDVEGLRPYVQVMGRARSLLDFLNKFEYLTLVLADLDACRRVALENVQDAAAEGLAHVELRFSPWFMAEPHGLDPQALTEAVIDGIAAGVRETGISASAIGIISRSYGVEIATKELEALLANASGLCALDLAGDELGYPAGLFRAHFLRAREAGLNITVHAGEADGPASVWSAIRDLGATRIGHGFRSIEDPELVEYLVARRIGLEICLTSNIQIDAVHSYREHPMKRLLDAGVLACLNTDNLAISGIDLRHEYEVAAPAAGLDHSQINQAQRNAIEMAFLGEAQKSLLAGGIMGTRD